MNEKIAALITAISNYTNIVTSWTSQTHKLWITNTPEDVTVKALNSAGVLVDRVIPNMAKITQGHLYMGPSIIVVGTAAELHAAVDSLNGRHITDNVTIELSATSYTLTKTLVFRYSGTSRGVGVHIAHSHAVAPTITMPTGVGTAIHIDMSTLILDFDLGITGVSDTYGNAIYINGGVFNMASGVTLTINQFNAGLKNNYGIVSLQKLNFTNVKYPVTFDYSGTGYISEIDATVATNGYGIRVHNGSYLYALSVSISGGHVALEITRSHVAIYTYLSNSVRFGIALYQSSSLIINGSTTIGVSYDLNSHGLVVQDSSTVKIIGDISFTGETLANVSYGANLTLGTVTATVSRYGIYAFSSSVNIGVTVISKYGSGLVTPIGSDMSIIKCPKLTITASMTVYSNGGTVMFDNVVAQGEITLNVFRFGSIYIGSLVYSLITVSQQDGGVTQNGIIIIGSQQTNPIA